MRAVDGDDIHPGQHLVEAVPIGRFQLFFDPGPDRLAVVIMDLQAEGFCPARDGLADPAHADDAEALAGQAAAQHPGRRPAIETAGIHDLRAFIQAARHGKDQRHGDIGRVIGQHARRVGHGDAALDGALHVDIVHTGAKLGDEAQLLACARQKAAVDMVGHGGHQHIGGLHRLGQFFLCERVIVLIEAGVEQLLHPQFHRGRQFASDDDLQLPGRHEHPLYLLYSTLRRP